LYQDFGHPTMRIGLRSYGTIGLATRACRMETGAMIDPDTIAFYQERAPHWVFHSGEHHSHQLDAFLDRLPAGAAVLELGCGGGRDAARMQERGFAVDPTDATPALVARARQAFGVPARVMAFHELEAETAYAGVWAHASLLHCPRDALPGVLARIHRALHPGGWHFASFKLGEAEGRDLLGRLHNFPPPEWLVATYGAAGFIIEAQMTYIGKASDGTQRDWIDLTVRKP
jgi:SAM-dependent methyltransferase